MFHNSTVQHGIIISCNTHLTINYQHIIRVSHTHPGSSCPSFWGLIPQSNWFSVLVWGRVICLKLNFSIMVYFPFFLSMFHVFFVLISIFLVFFLSSLFCFSHPYLALPLEA